MKLSDYAEMIEKRQAGIIFVLAKLATDVRHGRVDDYEQKIHLLMCPFCGEEDFDKDGLKLHLERCDKL